MSRSISSDAGPRWAAAAGLAALLLCLAAPGNAAEGGYQPRHNLAGPPQRRPLETRADLVLVLRVANVQAFGEKLDRLLRANSPSGWFAPGATTRLLASYLRAPGLESLEENAFCELLLFDPKRSDTSPVVLAFPVEEPRTYVRLVSGQPAITSQVLGNGVIHLREQHRETADFFLVTVDKRIIVFSRDRKNLEKARALYEESQTSLLSKPAGDLEVRLHLQRLMTSHAPVINQALAQLHADVTGDIAAEWAGLRQPARRVTDATLTALKGLADQVGQINAVLRLNKSLPADVFGADPPRVVELRCDLQGEAGDLTYYLAQAEPRAPTLPARLPAGTLSFDWSTATPETLRLLLGGVAGLLGTGLEEPFTPEARTALQQALAGLAELDPRETLAATVAPRDGGRPFDPQTLHRTANVFLARLGAPERLPRARELLARLTAPDGAVAASLRQNDLVVTSRLEPAGDGAQPARLHLTLEIRLDEEAVTGQPNPIRVTRTYCVGHAGEVVFLTTGREAVAAWRAIDEALRRDAAPLAGVEVLGPTLAMLRRERYLHVGLLNPLPYLQAALRDHPPAGYGGADEAERGPAELTLPGAGAAPSPLLLLVERRLPQLGRPTVRCSLVVPHDAVRRLAQAFLSAEEP